MLLCMWFLGKCRSKKLRKDLPIFVETFTNLQIYIYIYTNLQIYIYICHVLDKDNEGNKVPKKSILVDYWELLSKLHFKGWEKVKKSL